MTVTHEIKQQLLRSADAHQLQSLVLELGMRSLRQEGADLVVKGITSSEEVFRVTRDVEGV
jgi:type II secretory ATPase GspE/PulE/Tfp pilus assembly ATPase PilB-like protein